MDSSGWINVEEEMPDKDRPCLVKLVTDNKIRKEVLSKIHTSKFGFPDMPDEIITRATFLSETNDWWVMWFKLHPKFQKITHWQYA